MSVFRVAVVIFSVVMMSAPVCLFAGEPAATTLLRKQDLHDLRGKEGVVLTVRFAPGESSPAHRHNGHTFVYVLQGSVVMQVEGREPATLTKGDTFYESPVDIHKVARNASDTQPAEFLVFYVRDKGAPLFLPVE